MKAKVLLAGLAAVTVGSALNGCGQRPLQGGFGGRGGSSVADGRGGTTGRGGAPGRGGASAGTDGGDALWMSPTCQPTVSLGLPCTDADQQLCYKPCGPERQGVKSETCSNGAYVQMPGCAFDTSKDYSCYAIPSTANAACPATVTPQANAPCEVDPCVPCNSLGGPQGGSYVDSTGAAKPGYCVCQVPNAAGVRTWSCASDTAWPCPSGAGCVATGGSGVSGGGGTTGAGGRGGGGGTVGTDAGAGGTNSGPSSPPCTGLSTAAGMTPTKGGACGPADPQFCYKTCGPEQTGAKSETCTSAGVYAEMSGCAFDPSRNYSCYKIPSTANAACPAAASPPLASGACAVDSCVLCNSTGGLPGGSYLDSTGAARVGYCVCPPPSSSGTRTWSCASDTAWPCPAGSGC